ncbi:MAG: ABC transporter substrate-binding protein [Desulfobacterales bacterium]|nr:MAG: ABC transporter substrate-binding protein [Desulfobacterales bacterium]
MIFKSDKRILVLRPAFVAAVFLAFLANGAHAARSHAQSADIITDQGGRELQVVKPFQRIVSLYGAHTENLFSLGLDNEIIGVSPHEVYPPGALQKPMFSYHDDPEKFLAAHPDLVLIRPMIDRGYPQFVARLEKSGITVVSLQPATVDELYSYWEILGMLTGRQKPASAIVRQFQNAVVRLKSLTAALDRKKKVYFEAIHGKMKTFSQDSMAIFVLEAAGGVNVARDAKPVRKTNIAFYGKERILSHADDIDVYLAQIGTMNQPTIDLIREEPGFHAIKAIKNNEIYLIDERIVSRPTLRLLDGILEIGKILYPDLFQDDALGIVQNAKHF